MLGRGDAVDYYVYSALRMVAIFGGSLWCLYSVIFRWRAVTHRYGRIELYFWFLAANFVFYVLASGLMIAIWEIESLSGR